MKGNKPKNDIAIYNYTCTYLNGMHADQYITVEM